MKQAFSCPQSFEGELPNIPNYFVANTAFIPLPFFENLMNYFRGENSLIFDYLEKVKTLDDIDPKAFNFDELQDFLIELQLQPQKILDHIGPVHLLSEEKDEYALSQYCLMIEAMLRVFRCSLELKAPFYSWID